MAREASAPLQIPESTPGRLQTNLSFTPHGIRGDLHRRSFFKFTFYLLRNQPAGIHGGIRQYGDPIAGDLQEPAVNDDVLATLVVVKAQYAVAKGRKQGRVMGKNADIAVLRGSPHRYNLTLKKRSGRRENRQFDLRGLVQI